MSQRESRGTSAVTDPTSSAHHWKKVRRLFLLCTMLFCTDDRCSMPMHILVTDLIESQGGSTLLVQMLNRLGVCASADTLSRFIQHKVTTCDEYGMKHLTRDTFTVVSADNIDFMHSFARIFCGHQTSSWHGTTVQAAQPLPSLSLPPRDNCLTDPHSSGSLTGPPRGSCLTDPHYGSSLGGPPRDNCLTDPHSSGSLTGPPQSHRPSLW